MSENLKYSIKGILKFLALGGVITAAILAPNAAQAFRFLLKDDNYVSWENFNKRRTNQYINYLLKRELIKREIKKRQTKYKLTNKGLKQVVQYKIKDIKLPRENNWDKKWRLVIFDIPEKYKNARDILTERLKSTGMVQLQKSVFVYPFECKKEIDFISEYFGIYQHILYLEAKIADVDYNLTDKFKVRGLI